jgi:VanZ family protein
MRQDSQEPTVWRQLRERIPEEQVRHAGTVALWVCVIMLSSTTAVDQAANSLLTKLLSLVDGDRSFGVVKFLAQKGAHIFLFSLLGWLVIALISGGSKRRLLLATAATFAVGTCSESLQAVFPGRNPTLFDLMLNGVSGTSAAYLRLRFGI